MTWSLLRCSSVVFDGVNRHQRPPPAPHNEAICPPLSCPHPTHCVPCRDLRPLCARGCKHTLFFNVCLFLLVCLNLWPSTFTSRHHGSLITDGAATGWEDVCLHSDQLDYMIYSRCPCDGGPAVLVLLLQMVLLLFLFPFFLRKSVFMLSSFTSRRPAEQPCTSNKPAELDFTELLLCGFQMPEMCCGPPKNPCLFWSILIDTKAALHNHMSKGKTLVYAAVCRKHTSSNGKANINSFQNFHSSKFHRFVFFVKKVK